MVVKSQLEGDARGKPYQEYSRCTIHIVFDVKLRGPRSGTGECPCFIAIGSGTRGVCSRDYLIVAPGTAGGVDDRHNFGVCDVLDLCIKGVNTFESEPSVRVEGITNLDRTRQNIVCESVIDKRNLCCTLLKSIGGGSRAGEQQREQKRIKSEELHLFWRVEEKRRQVRVDRRRAREVVIDGTLIKATCWSFLAFMLPVVQAWDTHAAERQG
jgi:hypothetical protein